MLKTGKALLYALLFGLSAAHVSAQTGQQMQTSSHADAKEAEIEQLWVRALTRMRAGAPRAALDDLERLVTLAPETARFRLELARALYLTEEDDRAIWHFQNALAGQLSLAEIATVNQYLEAMQKRRSFQGHARVAVVTQSNPWYRSGEDFVSINGHLLLPLAPVESATGIELGLGGTWTPRISQDLQARAHVMLSSQLFPDKTVNRHHIRGEFGVISYGDYGRQLTAGITLQQARNNEGRVMQGVGVHGAFQRRFGRQMSLSIRGTADQLRYATAPQLNGPRYSLSVNMMRVVSPQARVTAGVHLTHHHTEAAFNRNSTAQFKLGGQYAFAGGLQAALEASVSRERFAEANPLQLQYGPQRSTRLGLQASLMHRDLRVRGFAPVAIIGYDVQRSNVPMQSFDNVKFSIAATRNF